MRSMPGASTHPASAHAPIISSVAATGGNPLWSVMIPTYNSSEYLAETLSSILVQDPGSDQMQIEVVDDCSTQGNPEALVEEIGRGRVQFHRQPANVGHSRNFNTCLNRARGRLVHILHSDDRVVPGFYNSMGHAFEVDEEIGAAFCGVTVIDAEGNVRYDMPTLQTVAGRIDDAVRVMAVQQPVETPSIVVRRDVYEQLGGFDERLRFCGEDLEMWVRIAAHFPIWYEPDTLACYRTHTQSLSGTAVRTGQNIRDVRVAIDTFQSYLPAESAQEITAHAREEIALWALNIAREARWKGDLELARTQMKEALLCSRSRPVLMSALGVLCFGSNKKAHSGLRKIRKLAARALPWRRADKNSDGAATESRLK
jgi:GT2 family glycosyltransferase